MYRPEAFDASEVDAIPGTIEAVRFGTLVTFAGGGYHAGRLPFHVSKPDGVLTLEAHMARADDHWRMPGDGAHGSATFSGPQAYVSPSWYPSKARDGKVVPTWSYIEAHASGPTAAVTDPEWLAAHLDDLTDAMETGRAAPWRTADAPARYIDVMTRGLVGVRLSVSRLEGERKLSQNKSAEDRRGVIAGLIETGDPQAAAVAEAMREEMNAKET